MDLVKLPEILLFSLDQNEAQAQRHYLERRNKKADTLNGAEVALCF
jgi:hypothetical protein